MEVQVKQAGAVRMARAAMDVPIGRTDECAINAALNVANLPFHMVTRWRETVANNRLGQRRT